MMRAKLYLKALAIALMARLLYRWGYEILPQFELLQAMRELNQLYAYVERSGHLQTARGKTPKARTKIARGLASIMSNLLHHGVPSTRRAR